MVGLPHIDPLNELSAYREALRQLAGEGWGTPQSAVGCFGIGAGSGGCD